MDTFKRKYELVRLLLGCSVVDTEVSGAHSDVIRGGEQMVYLSDDHRLRVQLDGLDVRPGFVPFKLTVYLDDKCVNDLLVELLQYGGNNGH